MASQASSSNFAALLDAVESQSSIDSSMTPRDYTAKDELHVTRILLSIDYLTSAGSQSSSSALLLLLTESLDCLFDDGVTFAIWKSTNALF